MKTSLPSFSAERRFALYGGLVYGLVGLPRVVLHEMWRDECGPWLIGQASSSFSELLANTANTGHPWLWYTSVWVLGRLVGHPMAMQFFHLLLATGTAYVVLRFAPWSRSVRLLLTGGYFLFFEYAVIARNYAFGVLFLVLFCAVANRHRSRPWAVGVLLFLMAQTSVFGAILTLAAVVWLGVDLLERHRSGRSPDLGATLLAGGLALAGVVVGALDMLPPADGLHTGWRLWLDFSGMGEVLATLQPAYLPFPRPGIGFWNTNLLDAWPGFQVVLSGVLLLLVGWVLRRRPAALAFWGAATFGTLAFLYLKYFGYLRHHGHLFLALVAALWLAARGTDKAPPFSRLGRGAWVGLLLIHLAAGLYAGWVDLRRPFSDSREAARFARARRLSDRPLAGHPDHTSSCVALWLEHEMYYPRGDRVGTWVRRDRQRGSPLSLEEALHRVRRRAAELGEPVILFGGFRLPRPLPGVEELYRTEPAVVNEVLAIYRVRALEPRSPMETPAAETDHGQVAKAPASVIAGDRSPR